MKRPSRARRSRRRKARARSPLPAAARRAGRAVARLYRAAPPAVRGLAVAAACTLLALAVNWVYQVIRKPSELWFPVSGLLEKTPEETWVAYGHLFRRHSTAIMTPDLLAALAQVEGSGNPVARTYWRFSLTSRPFEVYRPASSGVGMYQITNGTFAEARRYCIHDHRVAEVGPWYAWRSCWFNALYTRVVPSHAVELTSAYLHRAVERTLARQRIGGASLEQQRRLAAVIHLCGAGAGARFAARGFAFAPAERCGAHDAARYVARVERLRERFRRLAGPTVRPATTAS
ncbi:MAG TPA: lytic transglycosylase domain-containing protein [Gammaproteobacteria bacterium]